MFWPSMIAATALTAIIIFCLVLAYSAVVRRLSQMEYRILEILGQDQHCGGITALDIQSAYCQRYQPSVDTTQVFAALKELHERQFTSQMFDGNVTLHAITSKGFEAFDHNNGKNYDFDW
jgi:hypothetical protein